MDRVIEHLLKNCHHSRFEAKSLIIQQGGIADELFYILKGSVTVLLQTHDNHEIVLAYLEAGEFFGEIGLFDENAKRSATVYARTPCEVASINYEKLKSLPIYSKLVLAIAPYLARRLRKTNRKVGDIAFTDISGRIFRALVDLCKEPDAITHPQGMQLRITRQELGRIAGCSRETAGRILKRLEKQHLISARGKTIIVFGDRR